MTTEGGQSLRLAVRISRKLPPSSEAASADGGAGNAGSARSAHLLTSARLLRAQGRHREALGLLEEAFEAVGQGRTVKAILVP